MHYCGVYKLKINNVNVIWSKVYFTYNWNIRLSINNM